MQALRLLAIGLTVLGLIVQGVAYTRYDYQLQWLNLLAGALIGGGCAAMVLWHLKRDRD